jgi:hypothetical protein
LSCSFAARTPSGSSRKVATTSPSSPSYSASSQSTSTTSAGSPARPVVADAKNREAARGRARLPSAAASGGALPGLERETVRLRARDEKSKRRYLRKNSCQVESGGSVPVFNSSAAAARRDMRRPEGYAAGGDGGTRPHQSRRASRGRCLRERTTLASSRYPSYSRAACALQNVRSQIARLRLSGSRR